MGNKSLSVVIPALNERRNLELLVPRITAACRDAGIECEVLIIDSDSDDGTPECVDAMAQTMVVRRINVAERGNLALAWRAGISSAAHPMVATMDADFSHEPSFLIEMFNKMPGNDLVIAARYMNKGRQMKNKNILFEIVSRLGQIVSKLFLRISFYDISHGFRMFRKQAYEAIEKQITAPGNAFMIDFTYQAHVNGLKILEIPYTYGKRIHGKDKMRPFVEGPRLARYLLSHGKRKP